MGPSCSPHTVTMALRNTQVAVLLGVVCLAAGEPEPQGTYNTAGYRGFGAGQTTGYNTGNRFNTGTGFNTGAGFNTGSSFRGQTGFSGQTGAGYAGQGIRRQSGVYRGQLVSSFGGQTGYNRPTGTGFGFSGRTNTGYNNAGNQFYRGAQNSGRQDIARTISAAQQFGRQYGQTGYQNY